jgi:signal transduction histidine kinase
MGAFASSTGHAERVDSVVPNVPAARNVQRQPREGVPGSLNHAVTISWLTRAGWLTGVLGLTLAAVVFGHGHRGQSPLLALVVAAAATAPLLVVRRWPLAALSLVVVADATFVIWGRLSWPPTAVVAWLVALAACPLLLRRPHALVLLVATEASVLAAVFVPTSVNPRPWDAPITEALAVLLAWGGAEALRLRWESERRRIQMDEEMRGLQERAAVARGRAEIARELHDVVAHHVSLIAVRAAMAPYQLGDASEATAAAFTEIATEARAALDDLRAVLGVLRTADGDVPQAPQPCLADLPQLLERMRTNGMNVAFSEHGIRTPLSAAVELCGYRVVQEALTNSARHARGAPVEVTIDYRAAEIALTITDLGAGPPGFRSTKDGAGYGLIGMRERVAALGGQVAAAQLDTGFQVEARVPIQTPGRIS